MMTKSAGGGRSNGGVEERLLSKIIRRRDLKPAMELGVRPDFFHGDNKQLYKYIVTYFSQYGEVPHRSVALRRFPRFTLLKTRAESFKAIIDELREREQYNAVQTLIQEAAKKLSERDNLTASADAREALIRGMSRFEEIADPSNSPALYSQGLGELEPISLGTIDEPPAEDRIMGGLIAKGFPSTFFGDGGQGKSLLALAMAFAVATGKSFLGYPMPEGAVLYIDWELSVNAQGKRAFNIARGMGLAKPPKNLFYLAAPVPLPRLMARIRRLVVKHRLTFVVVDSYGPACGGNPEAAESVMPLFNELRSLGVTTLILDHQSKIQEGQHYSKKSIFGSTYKFALSRSVVQLERIASNDSEAGGELKVRLRHTKNNLGPLHRDLGLSVLFENAGKKNENVKIVPADMKVDPDFMQLMNAGEKIIQSLREVGPATKTMLKERTGMPIKTIENTLPRLATAQKIKESGKKEGKQIVWELGNSPTPQVYTGGETGEQGLRDLDEKHAVSTPLVGANEKKKTFILKPVEAV